MLPQGSALLFAMRYSSTMARDDFMMHYAFGGPMDGLIVRAPSEDGRPSTSRLGVGRKLEYEVRELISTDGTRVFAFVHHLLSTNEASQRYRLVSGRSRQNG